MATRAPGARCRRVWDSTSRKEVATLKKHEGAVTSARFSADGKLLVTTGADGTIVVWDTAKWEPISGPIILPGEVYSAVIGPADRVIAASSEFSEGVRFFDIATGRAFGEGIDLPSAALSIDLHPSSDKLVIACADSSVRTYGSPFLDQDEIPDWMPEFAERIVGMRVDGREKFAPVESTYAEMQQYPPPNTAPDSDFGRLAKWMVTEGVNRTTSPRATATIESNIVARLKADIQQIVVEEPIEICARLYKELSQDTSIKEKLGADIIVISDLLPS